MVQTYLALTQANLDAAPEGIAGGKLEVVRCHAVSALGVLVPPDHVRSW